MTKRHKLLERQIRRYLKRSLESGDAESHAEMNLFFEAVSQAYHDFDSDRDLIERSQDLSSRELLEEKNKAELKSQELEVAHQALIEAQEKLTASAKMSALGEMAGGVAHEINTPLAAISLKTELVLDLLVNGSIDKSELIDFSRSVLDIVERISKIVRGLRSFARDGKNDPMDKTTVSRIIEDTLSLCRERFVDNGVRLTVENFADQRIECRSIEISQVLLNLLNNSFDAVQALNEKWVSVGVVDHGNDIEISVTDAGTGISPEIRKKMMQPFFTTKGVGKGTGLGLSISKGIAESHGGSFTIDDESPRTKFVLRFPKSRSKKALVA